MSASIVVAAVLSFWLGKDLGLEKEALVRVQQGALVGYALETLYVARPSYKGASLSIAQMMFKDPIDQVQWLGVRSQEQDGQMHSWAGFAMQLEPKDCVGTLQYFGVDAGEVKEQLQDQVPRALSTVHALGWGAHVYSKAFLSEGFKTGQKAFLRQVCEGQYVQNAMKLPQEDTHVGTPSVPCQSGGNTCVQVWLQKTMPISSAFGSKEQGTF